jgi:hypothetical protein
MFLRNVGRLSTGAHGDMYQKTTVLKHWLQNLRPTRSPLKQDDMRARMRTLRIRANQETFATKHLTEARRQEICVQGRVIVRLVLLRDLPQLPRAHTGLLQ